MPKVFKTQPKAHSKVTFTKKILVFVTMLLVLGVVSAIDVLPFSSSDSANLVFSASTVDPVPVQPGNDLIFKVVLHNYGNKAAENVIIRITPDSPIKLKNGANLEKSLGNLCALCSTDLTYYLYVDPTAYSADYKIKLEAGWGNQIERAIKETEFDVNVRGTPKLVMTEVVYSPAEVEPDSKVDVSLIVANKGSGVARNLAMTLGTLPTGVTGKPLFSLIGSGSQFSLGNLEQGQNKTVRFELAVDPNTPRGVYNLPVTFSFSDTTQSDQLGIIILSKAMLKAPKIETDPREIAVGDNFILSVTVSNIGKNDAKSVRVNLIPSAAINGNLDSYLGTIKADDKDVALFDLTLKSTALANKDDELTLAFNITYSDDLGDHSIVETGKITTVAKKAKTEEKGLPVLPLAGALIILGGAYWFFFRRKETKQSK